MNEKEELRRSKMSLSIDGTLDCHSTKPAAAPLLENSNVTNASAPTTPEKSSNEDERPKQPSPIPPTRKSGLKSPQATKSSILQSNAAALKQELQSPDECTINLPVRSPPRSVLASPKARRRHKSPPTRESSLTSPEAVAHKREGVGDTAGSTAEDRDDSDDCCTATKVPKRLVVPASNHREFDFDVVFPPTATQNQVYSLSIGDSIRCNLFQGFNTTVLAYGQTGSGKTYTMGPSRGPHDQHDGIICRAILDLFRGKRANEVNEWDVSISLNCLELFNEEFRDLLADPGDLIHKNLKLRSLGGSDGRVAVEGVTCVQVESVEHATDLVNQAAARRATASTLMNEQSSRSHAIYTFHVTMEHPSEELSTAKLTLVDLAGSERIKQTGVVGSQQKESININKDLFVLGKVVSQLSNRSERRNTHIPYRDSKLTRLLQDSLGGMWTLFVLLSTACFF
jgi:hypothetical protein